MDRVDLVEMVWDLRSGVVRTVDLCTVPHTVFILFVPQGYCYCLAN